MEVKKIQLPQLKPRNYQMGAWQALDRGARNILISHPRRHGKDVTTASILSKKAMMRVGSYYYLFPTRKWAERAIWNNIVTIGEKSGHLIDLIFPPEIVANKNNTDLKLTLINGSTVNMGGTDNLDFVGQGGYGYALSEFSLHKEEVTGFIAPILDEGNSFIIMNGTMRGKRNQLYRMYEANRNNPDWFCEWLKPEETKRYYWISDEVTLNPELQGKIDPLTGLPYLNIQDRIDSKMISYSLARQEYMNEALSDVANSVYGYEMSKLEAEGNIQIANHNNNPVYTFWDLGMDDPTAIVFATIDDASVVKIIDYYENTGHEIKHYLDIINEKKYNYAGHYMPHDAKKRMGNTGTNILDFCRTQYGFEARPIPKTNSVRDDIEIVRRHLPSCIINESCQELVEHLINYQWNATTGKILHNEHSHGADAVRMLFMAKHHNMISEYLCKDKPQHVMNEVDDSWILT
tara:strand:- start:2354 stop:3739 length:1386 start_codon:yes stop_codon:yes gene_type:complete